MKIVFVITGLDFGGAEKQLIYQCERLSELGHSMLVVSLTHPKEIVDQVEKIPNLSCLSLGMSPGKVNLTSIFKLRSILKKNKPDVVHSHMIHANILTNICTLFMKLPVVNTAHSVFEGSNRLGFLYSLTSRKPNICTHVSQEGLDRYIRKGYFQSSRSVLMDNAVQQFDTKTSLDKAFAIEQLNKEGLFLEANDKLFISVGRLEDVKDYSKLLYAIKNANLDNAKHIILGRGSLEESLKELTSDLGLCKKVFFLGAKNDVSKFLNISDYFVLTSKYEGLPIAVLEAMSHGLPIISTNVGALDKVLIDQKTGFVSSDNSLHSVSMMLENAINLTNKQYMGMSVLNRRIIKNNYSVETVANQWVQLYKDCR